MHRLTLAILAAAALLSACSDDSTAPAAVSTATRAARPSTLQLGQAVTITRSDTGGQVGTIRFVAAEALPTECIAGRRTGVTLAVRVEIVNGAGEQLPVPDTYQLQYVDGIGATRPVETASIYQCEGDYPAAVTAPPGAKTEGWLFVRLDSEPTELVYTPMVGDQTSTAGNIKILMVSPASVRVDVPDHLAGLAPTAGVPAPETTTAVAPSTNAARSTQAAPPTGRDSQGRPNGSGGALVGCAGENYQPGTGIYEDGSKGFAAECLPGGSMR
ncbi:hypothetical protein ACW2Q0_28120 [Nocardia sp. R16R-3T]